MTDNSKTTENKDRLSQYLTLRLKDYMFDELSSSYLDRAGIKEIIYMDDKYKDTDSIKVSKNILDTCSVKYRKYEPKNKKIERELSERSDYYDDCLRICIRYE